MKTIDKLLLLLFIGSSFIACTHDDSMPFVGNTRLLPAEIVQEYYMDVFGDARDHRKNYQQFTYNDSDRLIEFSTVQTAGGSPVSTLTVAFTYNSEGGVTQTTTRRENLEENTDTTVVEEYSYTGNRIEVKSNGQLTKTLQLNDRNQLTGYIAYLDDNNQCRYEYTYDKAGNLTLYTSVYGEHVQTEKYETDRLNGIYKSIVAPQWLLAVYCRNSFFNNPSKLYSSANDHAFELLRTYEYQYNADGYPVVQKSILAPGWLGGSNQTLTVVYTQANIQPAD